MPDRRLSSMLYGVLGRIIARVTGTGFLTLTGSLTADRSKTFQNTTGTIAELESAQTFTVAQTISDTTSASSSITGALKIGNGVAATSVGIGGGNINAGGAGTFGGNVTVTTATATRIRTDTSSAGAIASGFDFLSGAVSQWSFTINGGTAGDKSFVISDNQASYNAFQITRTTQALSIASFLGTLDATSASSASVVMSGGLGVAKTLVTGAARILKTLSVVTAAGTTTGLATDHVVIFTGTTTQTYTLPAAAAGRQLIIKNRSTGALTVNRAGADTIDGLTTLNVAAGAGIILVANGTDWCVI